MIFAGVLIAVNDRVGNVKTWLEVKLYFGNIQTKCMRVISGVFENNKFYQETLWNNFIESLFEEHLLSFAEKVSFREVAMCTYHDFRSGSCSSKVGVGSLCLIQLQSTMKRVAGLSSFAGHWRL